MLRLAIFATAPAGVLAAAVDASCACKFQGGHLPESIYGSYPEKKPAGCTVGTDCTAWPGMYSNLTAYPGTKPYGTTCAPWDQMPGTPWYSYCPSGSAWGTADYNWCQQPWCYVDSGCATGVATSTFKGSPAGFYSYLSCGHTADCYSNIAWNASYVWPTGCPYDPTGGSTYRVDKSGDCACLYHGALLPASIYDNYPEADATASPPKTPGMYANLASIKYYGSSCAAWDQMPDTPWFSYCPSTSDWCHADYNWCQQPWCYVATGCSTGVASSVFKGSPVAKYSYNTCLNSPDCYTDIAWNSAWATNAPETCPFDSADNGWWTAGMCASGFTGPTAKKTSTASSAVEVGVGPAALLVAALVALLQ